jgi:hypothetical protein
MLLPNGILTSPLPVKEPFRFVGIPPLWGSLTGSRYIVTANAFTGTAGSLPLSSVGLFATTTEETVGVGAFLEIPKLVAPESSATWDRKVLRLDREAGGADADLTVIDVASGGGLLTWRIVAPSAPTRVRVPDLSAIDDELALTRGPIVVKVTAARVDNFSYGTLRYRQLAQRGWRAYAQDQYFAEY